MATSPLGFRTVAEARAQMEDLGPWDGDRATMQAPAARKKSPAAKGSALSTWKQLVDNGSLQDGDDHYAATARAAVARVSQRRLRRGRPDGDPHR